MYQRQGPDSAAARYLQGQSNAPYSPTELAGAVTRFQRGNANPNNPIDAYVRNSVDPVTFAAILGVSVIDGDGGRGAGGRPTAGVVQNKPLGLGSTGRTEPANLIEQLAIRQAMSNPSGGTVLTNVKMTDPRWPASDGWVKMSQNVNGVEIHYVRNKNTGSIDDFKFK